MFSSSCDIQELYVYFSGAKCDVDEQNPVVKLFYGQVLSIGINEGRLTYLSILGLSVYQQWVSEFKSLSFMGLSVIGL